MGGMAGGRIEWGGVEWYAGIWTVQPYWRATWQDFINWGSRCPMTPQFCRKILTPVDRDMPGILMVVWCVERESEVIQLFCKAMEAMEPDAFWSRLILPSLYKQSIKRHKPMYWMLDENKFYPSFFKSIFYSTEWQIFCTYMELVSSSAYYSC